ncbi:TadE/TadG family type IV pilus assembly protein [Tropicibacter naphthalenivorans]|uniref:TadE/TadG family type IV pilus assembly protein n=1 Tax=Tropicibacter naphthalenivorans TaxID=441103 RepID=UPI001F2255CC|nr:TadE/TadG family type IV pilus assembly protein [Tropicibacter naphthalenivorans]
MTCPQNSATSATGGWLGRFWSDQSGNMSYLAITGALVMMVFGGIGIDMIHAELKRNKIQNTLDRAVLAAADLQNEMDPTFVVEDYFRAMNMSDTLVDVQTGGGINARRVTATGTAEIQANFMKLLGVKSLGVDGLARAEEGVNKIEVSLVLDVSGSMADNNKMSNLRTAAKSFFDTLLTPANKDLVSISLVPYSEHVNPGPDIASNLNVNWRHGYSHCLEFPDEEFASTELNYDITYEQTQHFQWNYFGANDRDDTICPQFSYERITPFSQDITELKAQIDALQPRAGTSMFLGMKWGAALLDPSTQNVTSGLISRSTVDSAFLGRPVQYEDTETIKTIVLMTDGQHDQSMRIRDWAYNSDSEIQLWARYNMWYYLVNAVHSNNWGYFYEQKYNAAQGDTLLNNICSAAKDQGVIIWTVGFETTDHGASVLQKCASSPSHFFRVEGLDIADAFSSIAHTINQLRLTQ